MNHGIDIASRPGESQPSLPDDLSVYLGKKTLVKLVLEAVEQALGTQLDYKGVASAGAKYQLPMMLTLLTYSYATGAYGSHQIELNIQGDPMTRYLCARSYPDVDALRACRRHHLSTIHACLTATLRRAWELRFAEETDAPVLSVSHDQLNRGAGSEPDFSAEAEMRLARSIRADSMALDV